MKPNRTPLEAGRIRPPPSTSRKRNAGGLLHDSPISPSHIPSRTEALASAAPLLVRSFEIGRYRLTMTAMPAVPGRHGEVLCTWSPHAPARFESHEDEQAFDTARHFFGKELGLLLGRPVVAL